MTLEHLAGLEHHPSQEALAGLEPPPPPWGTASWRCSKPSSLQAKTKARSLGDQALGVAADTVDTPPARASQPLVEYRGREYWLVS